VHSFFTAGRLAPKNTKRINSSRDVLRAVITYHVIPGNEAISDELRGLAASALNLKELIEKLPKNDEFDRIQSQLQKLVLN